MARFDAIKISELPISELVLKDDLMVVDRLQAGRSYVTNALRIGKLVDYITTLDLDFTGNVTFNNTIQPLPGNSLDAIFDNVLIRQSITIEDGVEVNGLYLDDLEDVTIDSPVFGDTLIYTQDPLTRESKFINAPGIPYPETEDGRIYGWSSDGWVDITDCLKCPSNEIGTVVIIQVDGDSPNVGTVHTYRATTPIIDSSITDLTYEWTADSNLVTITNPTSQSTNVTFAEPGVYSLVCKVSSNIAIDSPQYGRKSISVISDPTCRIQTDPGKDYIVTELGDHLQFEPNVCSPSPSPDPGGDHLEYDANGDVYVAGDLYIDSDLHQDDTLNSVSEITGKYIQVSTINGDCVIKGDVYTQFDKDILTENPLGNFVGVGKVEADSTDSISIKGRLVVAGDIIIRGIIRDGSL